MNKTVHQPRNKMNEERHIYSLSFSLYQREILKYY